MNIPLTPYVGMPAARRYRPSVAPDSWVGTTGTPGWRARTTLATAAITSGRSGDASLAVGEPITLTSTFSPTTSCSDLRTVSMATPGKMRQLTVAVADCGNALSA